jgi:hypothetical protein
MIITVVEARVAEEHWPELQDAYAAKLQQLGPGIVQTFLVHSLIDSAVWQIMTIWASLEMLQATRQPGQTPPANLMFRAAGAEPTHTVFDIAMQAKAS